MGFVFASVIVSVCPEISLIKISWYKNAVFVNVVSFYLCVYVTLLRKPHPVENAWYHAVIYKKYWVELQECFSP